MKKEEVILVVILLLIAIAGIFSMVYLEASGKAWQMTPPSYVPIPTPQPAPSTAMPRIGTVTESRKPSINAEAKYYLQPGKYTAPDYEIKQLKIRPISLGDVKPGRKVKPWEENRLEFNQIRGIFKLLDEFSKYKKDDDNSWDLTVTDIFKKGINDNYCDQYGRVFITLARTNGIPTKYLQAYNKNWADGQKKNNCWFGDTQGHVYAQVYVDGNWHGVDPTQRKFVDITDKGQVLDEKGNINAIVYAEGRDSGDILPYINRWCLEGLRYHTAIPGLLLCPGKKGPDKNQLMMMMACSKPLQTILWQEKR
ncbi:transglutaminase family protein [Candidatus Woesearchaeota archaeon]|nr:transglutaminase family protein [Candidatus Woesearchaeota archaeon]MBW3005315.1 transglutaminase family protein [Candidatus Woesearchaeota archaeon]